MPSNGLLAELLYQLDIPGDAKLIGVQTTIDPSDNTTIWTVQYKAATPPIIGGVPGTRPHRLSAPPSRPDSPRGGVALGLPSPTPLREASVRATLTGAAEVPAVPSSVRTVVPGGPQAPAPPTPSMMMRCFPLKCTVQTYAWGKVGLDSVVARIAESAMVGDLEIEDQTPYAELWMGTHPNGPSMVVLETPWKTITPLSEWLKLNPVLAGSQGVHGHVQVPFLFKVLSVRTALSIQAHPDKELARELHATRADLYKDDNHKPEMAIAVTPFEALCGFQRATSIVANCNACPELVELIGDDSVAALDHAATSSDNVKPTLRELYTRLMTAPQHVVAEKLHNLMSRIEATVEMLRMPVDALAQRIHAQYPGDVGVFCVYLLNYRCLKPGEALFMAANEPHAYLYGDCIECMACSDNVVRAGLTPKFKDTNTLCSMLTYNDGPIELIQGQPVGKFVQQYMPPPEVDEFRLERCQLPPSSSSSLKAVDGVGILVVVNGSGTVEECSNQPGSVGIVHDVAIGCIFLVCAGTHLTLKTHQDGMLAFRAMARNA